MRGMRALLAAVIVMGVLIVVGTGALIAVVVGRMTHRPSLPGTPSVASSGGQAPGLVLHEPPGTRIGAITRQSETLVTVTLTGGGVADRLLVWDLASGRIVASLQLTQ